jgi:flagellar operon protein (TIGR03826 family)
MQVINCPRCGKVFTQIKCSICPSCEKNEEETFQTLAKFIDENQECTLQDLAKETDVSPKRILRFVREGRLEISKGMRNDIRCEVCGCEIPKGRYCDNCRLKINQDISNMFSDPALKKSKKSDDSSTMYMSLKSKR